MLYLMCNPHLVVYLEHRKEKDIEYVKNTVVKIFGVCVYPHERIFFVLVSDAIRRRELINLKAPFLSSSLTWERRCQREHAGGTPSFRIQSGTLIKHS